MPIVEKDTNSHAPAASSARASTSRKKSTGTLENISLPAKPNVPPNQLSAYSILIYGEKGIGKTSLAAEFPKSLVYMFEPGRKNLEILQLPKPGEEQLSWLRYKEYQKLILSEGTKKIQTIVVDTIDRAYETCQDTVCQERGIEHPSDVNDYGKTWRDVKREFEETNNLWLINGFTPIYISHARIREVALKDGTLIENCVPTCTDAAWQYLKAACDLCIYYGYGVNRSRVLTLRGNDFIWSACGFRKSFLDSQTNKPLTTILAGDSSETAYKALTDGFLNKLRDPEAVELEHRKEVEKKLTKKK